MSFRKFIGYAINPFPLWEKLEEKERRIISLLDELDRKAAEIKTAAYELEIQKKELKNQRLEWLLEKNVVLESAKQELLEILNDTEALKQDGAALAQGLKDGFSTLQNENQKLVEHLQMLEKNRPLLEQFKALEANSPTFAKLMQAIEAFPAEYPDYKTNPPQKKSVQAWLPFTFNLEDKDRTSVVFAKMIFEHFGITPTRT